MIEWLSAAWQATEPWAAVLVVVMACAIGVPLAALTLPGIWLMVAAATLCELWQPGMFAVRTLVIAAVIALSSDVFDFLAGAVGAKSVGGSTRSALGATIGGIIGALVGTGVLPIIGTILGGATGAGIGATIAQRTKHNDLGDGGGKAWARSARVGGGAAAGWFAAVVYKASCAAVVAVLLIAAAVIG